MSCAKDVPVDTDWQTDLQDYRRSGERSAHTWFVLHELLPIEKGA